jgi:hypothetical protein
MIIVGAHRLEIIASGSAATKGQLINFTGLGMPFNTKSTTEYPVYLGRLIPVK